MSITFKKNTPPQLLKQQTQIVDKYGKQMFQRILFYEYAFRPEYNISKQLLYQFMKYIQKWQITKFQIKITNPLNLIQIAHIQFSFLKSLSIAHKYQGLSIQSLSWMNFPFLQQLQLVQMNITSLKPLSKLNFSSLINIQLQYNLFNDAQLKYITQIKADQLVKLTVDNVRGYKKEKPIITTIKPLMKLQSNKLINLLSRMNSNKKRVPKQINNNININ